MWVVFDVDGVLIDTSESYDYATKLTAEYFLEKFGKRVDVPLDAIRNLRAKGVFPDDFKLSEALIIGALSGDLRTFCSEFPEGEGVEWVRKRFGIALDECEIERVFNTYYLGTLYSQRLFDFPGLWRVEKSLVDVELLKKLENVAKVGVVTGRDSLEMELAERVIGYKFRNVVTRDIIEKPDPRALYILTRGEYGIYIGDSGSDEAMIREYRKKFGDFGFIRVGRDVKDVNEAIRRVLLELSRG
ncbi:HAD family hydrolase [Pyrococcus sp. ST04]|uniref:HAD family hydrolase n=1 Tax=Pyrococcus sp. ST04 TaxID=1183377 RepID=UPI0002605E91|nr:HAD family hydrolase [Pyrococcus sp. ST04]AFK23218.1 putative HAD-superfamily hydrolase [Pyrococcus sp. ST04]